MAMKKTARPGKLVFITGTDTGVGKTVFTALMLDYLRSKGVRANAMKPFCSGGRGDAELLWKLQDREISIDTVNPFFFDQPVAPGIAAGKKQMRITKEKVLGEIRSLSARAELLLVEGAGGIFVPAGSGFMVVDLIQELGCPVVVVAKNCLGTINHTLLTVEALRNRGLRKIFVVLMGQKTEDESVCANEREIAKRLGNKGVYAIPFLGGRCVTGKKIETTKKSFKKPLHKIFDHVVSSSLRATPVERARCSEKKRC
jgi:dethiobiotin synthetase